MNFKNLTLDGVYKILFSCFKEDAHLIITSLSDLHLLSEESEKETGINTLAIDYLGNLFISPKFCEEVVKTEKDFVALLLHELLHQITNDTYFFKYLDKEDNLFEIKQMAANVAMDCRINAFIQNIDCLDESHKLFKRIYTDELIQSNYLLALLAPDNTDKIPHEDLRFLYTLIYSKSATEICSFRKLYECILKYMIRDAIKIDLSMLIGDHRNKKDQTQEEKDNIQKIKENISDFIKSTGGGYSLTNSGLKEQLLQEINGIDQKFDLDYFKRLSFDNVMNNVRLIMNQVTNERTKDIFIPSTISRADIFKMMYGQIPISWDVFAVKTVKSNAKIPIYLDVSGSMTRELPTIINLLLNVKEDLEYVWGFSEKIHKHTVEDLTNRRIYSTGGTNFDCIIEHAKENDFSSILIITDGDAYCSFPDKVSHIKDAVTVLCSSYRNRNNYFCKNYSVGIDIETVTL